MNRECCSLRRDSLGAAGVYRPGAAPNVKIDVEPIELELFQDLLLCNKRSEITNIDQEPKNIMEGMVGIGRIIVGLSHGFLPGLGSGPLSTFVASGRPANF